MHEQTCKTQVGFDMETLKLVWIRLRINSTFQTQNGVFDKENDQYITEMNNLKYYFIVYCQCDNKSYEKIAIVRLLISSL